MSGKDKKTTGLEVVTEPGVKFSNESSRLTSFSLFVLDLIESSDKTAILAAKALQKHAKDKYKDRDLVKEIVEKGAIREMFDFHDPTFLEIILCRGVDNFLTYVTQILTLIYRTKPEMLRSSDKIRLDYVLEHQNMEDLIHDLVERRVNDLSYQGMRKLNTYLAEKIGFQLIPNGQELDKTVRIIESRNLIVHNRGIVNELFLSRVPSSKESLGDRLKLDSDFIFLGQKFLCERVQHIDFNAVMKFSLPFVKMKEPD